MLVFGGKQQTVPDFLPQPGQHVRLPVQTPRRRTSKCQTLRMRQIQGTFKEYRVTDGSVLQPPELTTAHFVFIIDENT